MTKYDIVVIGGGPSGMVTAMTAKKEYGDKSVLMIKESPLGVVPCGIPYVFHLLGNVDKNRMGPKAFVDMGGKVLLGHVETVDTEARTLKMASGEEVGYDKLVFATGSRPTVPTFIPGHDKPEGVGYVPKTYEGIQALKEQADAANQIIVLGSGFTAVELAEQLAREADKEVHLVYRAEHCLLRAFSKPVALRVDEAVTEAGVIRHSRSQIAKITGGPDRATGIQLADGREMAADMVVIAMGYSPNSELADEAGVKVNGHGGISVDNYMRTSAPDVFAVGDCAASQEFITGRPARIMLASTAAAEARILGYNLYSMRIKRKFAGTLSVFSTELSRQAFASAGVMESDARADGIDIVVGEFEDVDRHPASLPGVSRVGARLVVSPGDGQIIGGELYGGKSVGAMVNTLALAIQKNVTVYELISFQLGTHPLLTTAPTKPILVKAAEKAITQMHADAGARAAAS